MFRCVSGGSLDVLNVAHLCSSQYLAIPENGTFLNNVQSAASMDVTKPPEFSPGINDVNLSSLIFFYLNL